MYQGNIGKLKNRRTGKEKWFQKLRVGDETMFVSVDNPDVKIETRYVDETNSKSERDYEVMLEISGANVVRYCTYNLDNYSIEEHYRNQRIDNINKKINDLSGAIEANNYYLERYKQYAEQNDLYQKELQELKNQRDEAKTSPLQKYIYVYGKHNATGKEFCWILPAGVQLDVGDTAEVECSGFDNSIIVTRIEESYEFRNHKKVIRKII